jgi:predicted secreted protein
LTVGLTKPCHRDLPSARHPAARGDAEDGPRNLPRFGVVTAVSKPRTDQQHRPGRWPSQEHWAMNKHTISSGLRPLLALLIVGLTAAGCASASAKTIQLGASCDQLSTQKHIVETTEVAVGDQVKVTLCSNPTTGFSWQPPEISDASVVGIADSTFVAPSTGTEPVVGAAGTDHVTFQVMATGTSTVVLRYSQPWAGGTSSEWTYTLTVTAK